MNEQFSKNTGESRNGRTPELKDLGFALASFNESALAANLRETKTASAMSSPQVALLGKMALTESNRGVVEESLRQLGTVNSELGGTVAYAISFHSSPELQPMGLEYLRVNLANLGAERFKSLSASNASDIIVPFSAGDRWHPDSDQRVIALEKIVERRGSLLAAAIYEDNAMLQASAFKQFITSATSPMEQVVAAFALGDDRKAEIQSLASGTLKNLGKLGRALDILTERGVVEIFPRPSLS